METEEDKWEPTYTDFDEDTVTLCEYVQLSVMRNRNEISIVMQCDESEKYRGNGAVFWTDAKHLYLRFDWGTWYSVSNESPDICMDITRRRAITLSVFTGTDGKNYPIRVYKIDSLPEDLFAKPVPPPAEETEYPDLGETDLDETDSAEPEPDSDAAS